MADQPSHRPDCPTCQGRLWIGAATYGQFQFIGRMAREGRLAARECPDCIAGPICWLGQLSPFHARSGITVEGA